MNVTVLLTGVQHRVASHEADPRIVQTFCGERVALGYTFDPTSDYQRAVFPKMLERQIPCPKCAVAENEFRARLQAEYARFHQVFERLADA